MKPRNFLAKPVPPQPVAKAAAPRITTQGIWAARRAKDKERMFRAAASMVALASTQYCDTPTRQPPVAWRAAFKLAKDKWAGITYLKQFDAASVEAPKGVISYCPTPEAAEKVLRAYRPVGGH